MAARIIKSDIFSPQSFALRWILSRISAQLNKMAQGVSKAATNGDNMHQGFAIIRI